MSGKYFAECSLCHRMIGLILDKSMSKEDQRSFTCRYCQDSLKQIKEKN